MRQPSVRQFSSLRMKRLGYTLLWYHALCNGYAFNGDRRNYNAHAYMCNARRDDHTVGSQASARFVNPTNMVLDSRAISSIKRACRIKSLIKPTDRG